MHAGSNMAAPSEIFAECFPTVDEEVSNYVNGILEGGVDDFETADDLYDAIGGMLFEYDPSKSEEDIKEICERLLYVMKEHNDGSTDTPVRILDAPVLLSSMAKSANGAVDSHKSIWLASKEKDSTVNQDKLEKAEAKLRQKQERRAERDLNYKPVRAVNGIDDASASQQTNRKEAKMEAAGTNKSYDIRIENFDISFGEKTLLKGADLVIIQGRRYGLVGRNGIGKTTLLRMISNGSLHIPSHITVLHVEQEVVGDDTRAIDSILECDTKREALIREESDLTTKLNSTSPSGDGELSSRLAAVYHELEAIEADKAPAKAAMIMSGLGFTPQMQVAPTRTFSGGWRMRIALGRALFSKPDLLLLDEPTNMLDMKAIIWLENYLQAWPTTILCVSHDRQFLNSITTDTLHMHSQRIDSYRGDFETFVKSRIEKLKNQQREYEAQLEYRRHIQVFIDRFRYNANRASQVQSKLKLLEKLPELKPIEKESEVVIKFPETEKLSPPILQLDEVEFYYSKDHVIFKSINVNAAMDSRICIVGENGAGKTTLLKILLGDLDPVSGIRHIHRNLRLGYFSQHHVDQLDMNVCSVEVLANKFPGKPSEYYRQQLGSFGISGDLALRPVVSLSGGQKSRVAFAQMSMTNPNFFILDEPTNHLDMETIEALGKALNKFQGGVILVSHDERLIRVLCKELWVCKDGEVRVLEGGIDEYKAIVQQELAQQV